MLPWSPTVWCLHFLQAIEGGFAQVVMAMPDRRRRSPIAVDVERGLIPLELMRSSIITLTSRCDAVGLFLFGDDCLPCPFGASCPGTRSAIRRPTCFLARSLRPAGCVTGAGRIWPEKGFWNRGEMSGFVSKCSPSLRCLGGHSSQCAVGYEADYCAQCSTGYGLRATLGFLESETGSVPGTSR